MTKPVRDDSNGSFWSLAEGRAQSGRSGSILPLATILSPFIGGQLADRYFSSEKVIAFLQFTGGVLLILCARATSFDAMAWLMFIYCLLYAPTLALTDGDGGPPLADGLVSAVLVDVGDHVQANQVLARFDPVLARHELATAEAALAAVLDLVVHEDLRGVGPVRIQRAEPVPVEAPMWFRTIARGK